DERRAAAAAAADHARGARDAADRAAHEAREALDAARRARFETELTLERRRGDEAHLVEACRTEFACLPGELPALPEGESADEEALQQEAARRAEALERLGPVNHAALEEYDVESKRLAELSAQKLDLESSLAQIMETIRTINLTSAERF